MSCREELPRRALFAPKGLAGIACGHCGADLQPVPWRAGLVTAIAVAAGTLATAAAGSRGAGGLLRLACMAAVYAAVLFALMPLLLRFRVKPDTIQSLHLR